MAKTGTPCGVCEHDSRPLIEHGLVAGTPLRVLGKRFGLSHHAIGRHSRNHMPPQVRAAILRAARPEAIDLDALRESEGAGLLANLVAGRARLAQQAAFAAEMGDTRGAVAAEAGILSNLKLTASLLGQLVQHHSVKHTNLLVSPDYLALRAALIQALRPYPDAARAAAMALHRLESDAARDITETAKPAPLVIEHQPATIPPPPPC